MPKYLVTTTIHVEVETYVEAQDENDAIETVEFDLDLTNYDYTMSSTVEVADA